MRKYTINKAPGVPLQHCHREILQRDWNDRIEHGKMRFHLTNAQIDALLTAAVVEG